MRNIAILGSGQVGEVLAQGLARDGFSVCIGTRNLAGKSAPAGVTGPVVTYAEAAASADMLILVVKGTAAEEVVRGLGSALDGKTVLDATNPIADAPPENGVLRFFTSLDRSLLERLQALAPRAHFVKAFNSVGAGLMVHPQLHGLRPSMFICGADAAAKHEASRLIETLGWDVEDMGGPEAARAIEPLCMLWCIPGFRNQDWTHAFKILRP